MAVFVNWRRASHFGYNRAVRLHVLTASLLCALAACGRGNPGNGSNPGAGGADSAGGPVAVVRLQPSATDAPPADVDVPGASAQVQFRLSGIDRAAGELTAEIERVGADQIRRWPVVDAPADPDGLKHAVVVPIYEARPGEYVLTVWASDVEIVRRYRYRVTAAAK